MQENVSLFLRVEEMLERHFGPRLGKFATVSLLVIGFFAVVAFCFGVIWANGGKWIYDKIYSGISSISFQEQINKIDSVTTLSTTLIVSLIVLVIFSTAFIFVLYFFGKTLLRKNVPQHALDRLAELRNEAIETLYAAAIPKNDDEFSLWMKKNEAWLDKLLNFVQKNFPKADYLHVKYLGVVPGLTFPGMPYNNEHHRQLQFIARRLEIIESLLISYRR